MYELGIVKNQCWDFLTKISTKVAILRSRNPLNLQWQPSSFHLSFDRVKTNTSIEHKFQRLSKDVRTPAGEPTKTQPEIMMRYVQAKQSSCSLAPTPTPRLLFCPHY